MQSFLGKIRLVSRHIHTHTHINNNSKNVDYLSTRAFTSISSGGLNHFTSNALPAFSDHFSVGFSTCPFSSFSATLVWLVFTHSLVVHILTPCSSLSKKIVHFLKLIVFVAYWFLQNTVVFNTKMWDFWIRELNCVFVGSIGIILSK